MLRPYLSCRLSLFLKVLFFKIIQRSQQLSMCLVDLVEILLAHLYSVDIFSYSVPSGIYGSDGKQNFLKLLLGA